MAELTQYKEKESTISNTARKWKQDRDTLKDAVARGKQVTSGLACAHWKPVLDSEYQDIFIAKRQKKEDAERAVIVGKMRKFYVKLLKYNEVQNKHNLHDLSKLNNSKLKAVSNWFHRSKDNALPSANNLLI